VTNGTTVFNLQNHNHQRLQDELLKQWAAQAKYSPITVVVAMALIAFMVSQYLSAWIWGSWLAIVIGAQGLRWHVFGQLPKKLHIPVQQRIHTAVIVNVVNTVIHSASLVWFPLFSPYHGAVQTMLFIGMGVASVMMGVGFTPFALTHILLGLIPLFSLWAWSALVGDGGIVALVVAIAGAGYSATLFRIASRIFLLYKDSFDIRGQLEIALSKAEAAGRAKTRFLASASHDLRQPMHALALFSAALATRKLDDRTSHIVDNINASVAALTYELDGLLDISKLDAGIVTLSRTDFCVASLLRRLQEEFSPRAENRGIAIVLDCPERSAVNTDGALFERILRNLITNAIYHNTQCTVTLRIVPLVNYWQVVVADTGRGIAPAEQDHIFEEFYQLENPERDRTKGLGLGLSIVRRLSDLLYLQMEFESTPGQGTQFSFTVPVAEQELNGALTAVYAPVSLESLVVLVVDDELSVREGMRTLLESLGCNVATADSSDTAIAVAAKVKPNIALVDLRLRNHDDGLMTIERLRQLYPELPAIIISGDTAPDRLVAISKEGIPVLIKPVLIEPLRDAIIRNCSLQK
jgi:signal transduction histidine kinase/CheY-like chemotaxis protein